MKWSFVCLFVLGDLFHARWGSLKVSIALCCRLHRLHKPYFGLCVALPYFTGIIHIRSPLTQWPKESKICGYSVRFIRAITLIYIENIWMLEHILQRFTIVGTTKWIKPIHLYILWVQQQQIKGRAIPFQMEKTALKCGSLNITFGLCNSLRFNKF